MAGLTGKRVGMRTVKFANPPSILAAASVVGPKEGEGPLSQYFDVVVDDPMFGESTPERAETRFLFEAGRLALDKAKLAPQGVDYFLAGDLLDQIVSSSFAARRLGIPYVGLFGACATVAEGVSLGSMLLDGGFASKVLVATSSHYQSAERQFRYPIELNIQRKGTAQYTATGAGAAVLGAAGDGPVVTHATIGRVVDFGIKDPNDFGAAMAPAAVDTFVSHLRDLGRSPNDYDLVLTGDLAQVGKALFGELVARQGYQLGDNYDDCGVMLYEPRQETGVGGSGCACSAVVACGYVAKSMIAGKFRRVLLISTGALLSPLTYQQGESIPAIAHAIVIEAADVVDEGDGAT